MANESKLGILSGVVVVMLAAMFFQAKPSAGKASIGDETAPAPPAVKAERTTPPEHPPAGVRMPDSTAHTIWQPREPREVKPVSRDPLLWP